MNKTFSRFLCFTIGLLVVSPLYSQVKIQSILDDLTPSLNGKLVVFTIPLTVCQTYYKSQSGTILLYPGTCYTPTEIVLPGADAKSMATWLASYQITLKNSRNFSYINSDRTLRTGSTVTGLQGILSYDGSQYAIDPTVKPQFVDNERTLTAPAVGNSTLRVASFNVEFYIASSSMWSNSQNNGARNQAEFTRQRTKTLAALKGLNADVYALCEVGQGNTSMTDIVNGLNALTGTSDYAYVADGDYTETVFTKNVFIYNKKKVTPYGDYYAFGAGNLHYRQIAQAFQQNSNGERFIVTINHLKSKGSGYGNNADKGDGQGASNYDRIAQARLVIQNLNLLTTKYNDPDVLVVGDMNSYTMEDPMKVYENGGLVNQLGRFSKEDYSYVYMGNMGYLDHSWATSSLSKQVTGARPWHINADEPAYFKYTNTTYYSPTPYRCSDHDPIITGLALGNRTSGIDDVQHEANQLQILGNPSDGYLTLKADKIDKVEVVSGSGMLIYSQLNPVIGSYFVLPITAFSKGFYLVRVFNGKQVLVGKLLVP